MLHYSILSFAIINYGFIYSYIIHTVCDKILKLNLYEANLQYCEYIYNAIHIKTIL